MNNIQIERFENHPQGALGCIRYGGEGGPWWALIDAKGMPHLHVRWKGKVDGKETVGYIDVDQMVPPELTAAHLVDCMPGEDNVSDEDAEACVAEMKRRWDEDCKAGVWKPTGAPLPQDVPHICTIQ